MGCVVNGLGEGREADLAIVGSGPIALIMKNGKIINRVKEKDIFRVFEKELKTFL
jgi:(E)-4-hydroxy-3-methylbut-2-enyl-diphosphate synthase